MTTQQLEAAQRLLDQINRIDNFLKVAEKCTVVVIPADCMNGEYNISEIEGALTKYDLTMFGIFDYLKSKKATLLNEFERM
jgi:hypothetical protein